MQHTATYSPEDNKLRLYPACRLDKDDYDRVKAAGFKWAPKQELFVAPAWTPEREDLLIEMCGEIEDEDKSLVERAEEKAERLEDLSNKRRQDAASAHAAVEAICEHIPLGQPILVGHHSERHARKDAERIENGMRKAVKCWELSQYWKDRAKGALRHAKCKELPAVRARRIKGLEADLRKQIKYRESSERGLAFWNQDGLTLERARLECGRNNDISFGLPRKEGDREDWQHRPTPHDTLGESHHPTLYATRTLQECIDAANIAFPRSIAWRNRWIAHYENRLAYELAMLDEQGGLKADRFEFVVGGQVKVRYDEWLIILRINRKAGIVQSVRTTTPRYWGRNSYVCPVEEIRDYRPPTLEDSEKVKAATKLPPICNYPGPDYHPITQAQWNETYKDHKTTSKRAATGDYGAHRVRTVAGFIARKYGYVLKPAGQFGWIPVYITDAKRKDPPKPPQSSEDAAPTLADIPREIDTADIERRAAAIQEARKPNEEEAKFDALKDSLTAGVQVVTAPNLFPTPQDVARKMAELADFWPIQRILEPSAGTGNLIEAFAGKGRSIVAVEINPVLADGLRRRWPGIDTRCADFLECNGDLGTFDRIVMNPPFDHGSDIKHVEHACKFLKPGGRLVAIVANGPRQREAFEPIATAWIDLPAGTFKDLGTNVNTAIVVIDD
jgi:SAM-dependent methyltransferase